MAWHDVVVIGLGVTGKRGALSRSRAADVRVLGLERFRPGHDRGSSHGDTRLIRLGYFEHPSYVPLLRRAYELWRGLEQRQRATAPACHRHRRDRPARRRAGAQERSRRRAAHSLQHEVLGAQDLMRRYSAFRLPAGFRRRVAAGWRLPGSRAVDRARWLALAQGMREPRSAPAKPSTRSSRVAAGVRIVTDRGTIEAGTVDRRRRAVDQKRCCPICRRRCG